MKELPHTHSCFVCGESNPSGLKLRFETDGRIVQARFCPKPEHIGFKGVVHGGLIATVLDEIMVWACVVQTRQFAYCAELNVRFFKSLTPGQETILSAELLENRKGKLFYARGTASDASGKKLAESTGKYMPMTVADETAMAADFIGDPGWRLNEPPPGKT